MNIIAPIPMVKNNTEILHKSIKADLTLENFINNISSGQRLFAGCIPVKLVSFLKEKGINYFDFMEEESIAILNSIATAEGIIAEAVMKSPINLHNSKILVLGYGKCGKTLADKLKGLSGNTTVCVKEGIKKALAHTNGHRVITIENLINSISNFDFIFNTIPAVILNSSILKEIKPTAVVLDIASSPGGVDYTKAKDLGINANSYPGLPGKYAPRSSAIVLADYIVSH